MPIVRKRKSAAKRVVKRKQNGTSTSKPPRGRRRLKAANRRASKKRRNVRSRSGAAYRPAASVLPAQLNAAAVVSIRDEAATIEGVLHELKKLPLRQIIVVMNGSTDGSYDVVRSDPDITIVHYPEPLGHDVGRAVGARLASTDIILFVDGDIPIAASQLTPYLTAIHGGADVALNDLTPQLGAFRQWDSVSRVKAFMNRSLGRPELGAASMTAVPHALSRRAIETIGPRALIIPPKAQALAIVKGLKVVLCPGIDVMRGNRIHEHNNGRDNPVAGMIIGDHVEAIREVSQQSGSRLTLVDVVRKRQAAGGGAS